MIGGEAIWSCSTKEGDVSMKWNQETRSLPCGREDVVSNGWAMPSFAYMFTGSPPVRPTNSINDLGRPHQDSVRGETGFNPVPGNWGTSFSYTSTAGIEIVDDSNMKAYSILCSTPLVLEGPSFIRS
jgi:hypothetical protein